MIDTGEERDGSYIRETLEAAGIDHLNLLLVTHFDKDHVGSAAELLETVGADQVLMRIMKEQDPSMRHFCRHWKYIRRRRCSG